VGDDAVRQVGHRAEVALADRAEAPDLRGEALVQAGDDAVSQFGADTGDTLGVTVGEAKQRATRDILWRNVTLRYPVVQHQALVEPLSFGRIKDEFLSLTDTSGKAVNRFSAMQDFHYYLARCCHVGACLFRQADCHTLSRNGYDLRNSQVTSIQHDRHRLPTCLSLS
jgi:hypothetical protein